MLAHRRRCIDYSEVYSDITERWLLKLNQNIHITYYIHISYTNSEISTDLSYNSTNFLRANKHN